MKNRALVVTGAFAGVSVGLELFSVVFKFGVRSLCVQFKHDDHESSHEVRSVGHLIFVGSAIVEYARFLELLVGEESCQFAAVPVNVR